MYLKPENYLRHKEVDGENVRNPVKLSAKQHDCDTPDLQGQKEHEHQQSIAEKWEPEYSQHNMWTYTYSNNLIQPVQRLYMHV